LITDRVAPQPIAQVGNKGIVNPVFVEWMMGLPEGWVTGHGLSASQELKMLGNGVVPQQAALALRLLGAA
jgi:DNA (cytosine-5)-methyltransferase 1